MNKLLKFAAPAFLMLAGTLGMILPSNATVINRYSEDDYNYAKAMAENYEYGNLAIAGLLVAMDEQLPYWKEWKYMPYASAQIQGQVSKLARYPWEIDEFGNGWSNNFLSIKLIDAIGRDNACVTGSGYKFSGAIVANYDSFSKLVVCAKELPAYKNGTITELTDEADSIFQAGMKLAQDNWSVFFPNDNFTDFSVRDVVRKIYTPADSGSSDNITKVLAGYGSIYDTLRIADPIPETLMGYYAQLAWAGETNAYAVDFDVAKKEKMSGTQLNDFAKVYTFARANDPEFRFNVEDLTIPSFDNVDDQNQLSANMSNTGADAMLTKSSLGMPNTGLENQVDQSANNVKIALGSIAFIAGALGMIVTVKQYVFSPLKRK